MMNSLLNDAYQTELKRQQDEKEAGGPESLLNGSTKKQKGADTDEESLSAYYKRIIRENKPNFKGNKGLIQPKNEDKDSLMGQKVQEIDGKGAGKEEK